jgi:hypothetical protein
VLLWFGVSHVFFTKFLELYRVHGRVYVVGIILLVFFFAIRKWEHVSSGFIWSRWEVWMGFPIYFRGTVFVSIRLISPRGEMQIIIYPIYFAMYGAMLILSC